MVKKIRVNFSSLGDARIFLEMILIVPVLQLFIRVFRLPRLMEWLTPSAVRLRSGENPEHKRQKIIKFADYILDRNFWIYRKTCLKRSLLLYRFLRQAGIDVQLCLGVKVIHDGTRKNLQGHSWLVYKDDIFLEKDIETTKTFKVTYCFPGEA